MGRVPGGTPEPAPRMMFGGEGSGVPPGHHGHRSAIPPVNWRATVNGPYGTRDPSVSYYPGKRERPVCPRFSRSFALFAKGRSRKCRHQVGLMTCPQQNQIAPAASPPTLAKNARMGHPQWEWCTQESLKVGHPPIVISMADTADTNQHYVPQFLLRGFHTGNEAQIWAFDKTTSKSFTTAIDKVASEHGFYKIDGSALLDDVIRKIEEATAPIIKEIRDRKSLAGINEYKRIWLSGFTALQYVRTKAFTERSQDMMRQITQVVTKGNGGELPEKVRRQLGLDEPGTEHEKTLSTILGLVRPAVDELQKKHMVLYRSDGSSSFWIGDSPVAMQNSVNPGDGIRGTLGLAVPGIEVYLPISKDLILAHICPTVAGVYSGLEDDARRMGFIHAHAGPYLRAVEHGVAVVMEREHIRFQNSLQLGFAERFVYSSVDNFDDAHDILTKNPRRRIGPRYGRPNVPKATD